MLIDSMDRTTAQLIRLIAGEFDTVSVLRIYRLRLATRGLQATSLGSWKDNGQGVYSLKAAAIAEAGTDLDDSQFHGDSVNKDRIDRR